MAAKINGHLDLRDITIFVTSGSRGWAQYYADDGPLFIRIGNLTRGSIDLDLGDAQHVRPPESAEGRRTRIQTGDILVSVTADLGIIGFARETLGEAYVNEHIAVVRLDKEKVDPEWVALALASELGQEQFRRLSDSGAKAGLNLDNVLSLRIPKVPAATQKSTIIFLRSVDHAIEATRAVIEQTRKLKAALLQNLLTNGLPGKHSDFTTDHRLGRFPSSWKPERLGDIAHLVTSGSRGWSRFIADTGALFVRSQNIGSGVFLFDDVLSVLPPSEPETERARIQNGDLLISVTGDPGNICYFNGQSEVAYVSQHVALVRLNDPSLAPWITRALTGPIGAPQFQSLMYGQTRPGLNLDNIKELLVPVPEPEEQASIIEVVHTVQERIDFERNKLQQVAELKSSLSQGLLTGRISVSSITKDSRGKT